LQRGRCLVHRGHINKLPAGLLDKVLVVLKSRLETATCYRHDRERWPDNIKARVTKQNGLGHGDELHCRSVNWVRRRYFDGHRAVKPMNAPNEAGFPILAAQAIILSVYSRQKLKPSILLLAARRAESRGNPTEL